MLQHEKNIFTYLAVNKELSNDGTVGVARGLVFQEIRPKAGFQNRRFR